jgi:hypothetical protein
MILRETIRIENARLYPAATVDQLRTALSNGAVLQPNAARRNFYDLDTEGRTYFLYVSPSSGSITLIATWDRKRQSEDATTDGQAQWWRRITAHFLALRRRSSGLLRRSPANIRLGT